MSVIIGANDVVPSPVIVTKPLLLAETFPNLKFKHVYFDHPSLALRACLKVGICLRPSCRSGFGQRAHKTS